LTCGGTAETRRERRRGLSKREGPRAVARRPARPHRPAPGAPVARSSQPPCPDLRKAASPTFAEVCPFVLPPRSISELGVRSLHRIQFSPERQSVLLANRPGSVSAVLGVEAAVVSPAGRRPRTLAAQTRPRSPASSRRFSRPAAVNSRPRQWIGCAHGAIRRGSRRRRASLGGEDAVAAPRFQAPSRAR
jgi:hypothetical protein